jgi:hypothetical protein
VLYGPLTSRYPPAAESHDDPTVACPNDPSPPPPPDVTTAVCTDTAVELPAAFVAVTATRNVDPTSAAETTRLEPLPLAAQFEPAASQRRHSYPYEVGLPVQPPVLADSVCPSTADPEITGNAVFAGGCGPPVVYTATIE